MERRMLMPASLFGSVLGLAGLSNTWRAAPALWRVPAWPGELLAALAVVAWTACVTLYLRKWRFARAAAVAEAAHLVQCCYLSLIPVSTMLVALALRPYTHTLALALYVAGAVGGLVFAVWRQGALLRGGRELDTATPVLYLPSVASDFVAAIGAAAFSWTDVAQAFFGAGLLSWLAIESVLLHRMLHGAALAPALRPTLGVQLAPPAVGLVAFNVVAGAPIPWFASILLGYALLQVLLALRMLPWLLEGGFGPGFWSFTFGLTALSLGSQTLALHGHVVAYWLAPWLLALATSVVGAIAMRSVWLLVRGQLMPYTEATPGS